MPPNKPHGVAGFHQTLLVTLLGASKRCLGVDYPLSHRTGKPFMPFWTFQPAIFGCSFHEGNWKTNGKKQNTKQKRRRMYQKNTNLSADMSFYTSIWNTLLHFVSVQIHCEQKVFLSYAKCTLIPLCINKLELKVVNMWNTVRNQL